MTKSALIFAATLVCFAESRPTALVEIESGSATFDSSTNMPGVEVKGKSTVLTGRVEVSQEMNNLALQRIEASLPVKSLATGMKVRDEHMRKFIFTTQDGREPDLRFVADAASCPAAGQAHQFACQIPGSLSIRGVAVPVEIRLRVKEQAGSTFRVDGEGVVKLSDYGIVPPSQFGVKPANEVKFHLEFTGKQRSSAVASSEGLR